MPSFRKPLAIDAGRIYRWSFLAIFLVLEWILWVHIGRRVARPAGHRLAILLLAPSATWRAIMESMILAGVSVLAGMLFVRVVLSPLVNRWLSPPIDPSSWMFHLPAGEAMLASVPARIRSGGSWQPGALVLTGDRIWFLPASWGPEPWSLGRHQSAQVETEPAPFARYLPLQHWPERLRFTARSGEVVRFAVAEAELVLAWFEPATSGKAPPTLRAVAEGVFDV